MTLFRLRQTTILYTKLSDNQRVTLQLKFSSIGFTVEDVKQFY